MGKPQQFDPYPLHLWAHYISGALRAVMRLKEEGAVLFTDPSVKKAEREVYDKAMWEYLLSGKDNLDKFISYAGEGRFYDHKCDAKGKLISCKYGMFKRTTKYELL